MLALLLGCTEAPAPLPERWEADPQSTAAQLAALPPPAQLAAVEAILTADPAGAGKLCGVLTDGPARTRCRQVQARPHLWRQSAPAHRLPSPFAEVSPLTEPCGGHATPRTCWQGIAHSRAATGNAQAAAGACAAIAAARWQEECAFQAAEAAISGQGAIGYGDALALCALASAWPEDCLTHTVALLAERAPPTPGGDWAPIRAAAAAIEEAWAPIDPDQGAALTARLWALSTAWVYADAPAITGAPLQVLPAPAWPHVRAAAAWRLLALEPPGDDLASAVVRLRTALTHHQDTAPPTAPRRALTGLADRWADARAPHDAPVTSWLGVSQRVVADDPDDDLAICLLEAAARHPAGAALVASAADYPSPLVAWTAARLQP